MSITAVPLKPVKRSIKVYIWGGVVVLVAAAVALAFQGPLPFLAMNARASGVVTTPSGLQYKMVAPGTGPKPTDQDEVLVMYEGKLLDGTTFDKSAQPTPLGVAEVVPGFSEALKLMSKGAKYRFWIKPSLGYGDRSPPGSPIPPNSTLVFDVELLDSIPVVKFHQIQQQQQMMMQQQQGGMPGGPGAPGAAPPGGPGGMPPGMDGVPVGR